MKVLKGRKIVDFKSTASAHCGVPEEKIPPASGTNQIAEFIEFRPLVSELRKR